MSLPPFYVGENLRLIEDTIRARDRITDILAPWAIPAGALISFRAKHRTSPRLVHATASRGIGIGDINYALTTEDLSVPGIYDAAWEIELTDGTIYIVPFRDPLQVKAAL
jgi:hypothetical protein